MLRTATVSVNHQHCLVLLSQFLSQVRQDIKLDTAMTQSSIQEQRDLIRDMVSIALQVDAPAAPLLHTVDFLHLQLESYLT